MSALHEQYRPRKWDEVVGHENVTKALSGIIAKRSSQAFLFTGPAGVGKTTLARITASELGCTRREIIEIDAATYTGIDSMREVQDKLRYKPFGQSDAKAIIIDEAHGLSKQAWDSLLKVVEEPPEHVYWFFCTTNPGKIPTTIKTRCTSIVLNALKEPELNALLDEICELEKIKIPDEVASVVVREAHGSPRQMLVNLDLCRSAKTRKQAAELLHSAQETDATIQLAQFLIKGGSWSKAMAIYTKLEDENPESVRITVCNYIAGALKRASNDREACFFMSILDAFSTPYLAYENSAPLLLSIGRALFGQREA